MHSVALYFLSIKAASEEGCLGLILPPFFCFSQHNTKQNDWNTGILLAKPEALHHISVGTFVMFMEN